MSSVDVVIPCYNYGHYLADSVGSALDQPGVDVRVLIIDDASTDDSAERARALAATDTRIDVSAHPQNRGHIATYNEGLLDWCKSDYCVLLSADDMVAPGALTRAAHYLDAHPGSGFVYGPHRKFRETAELPRSPRHRARARTYRGQDWLSQRFRQGMNVIASPEVVVRTSVQQAVGGYDPSLPHSGDMEMWMRLAAHGDVGYLGGVDQAYYRVHGHNMSISWFVDAGLNDLNQRWTGYASFLEKEGDRVHERSLAEQVVRRRLASDALWLACRAYDDGAAGVDRAGPLVEFAETLYPGAPELPEWRHLALRRRLGPARMPAVSRVLPSTYLWPLQRRLGSLQRASRSRARQA